MGKFYNLNIWGTKMWIFLEILAQSNVNEKSNPIIQSQNN